MLIPYYIPFAAMRWLTNIYGELGMIASDILFDIFGHRLPIFTLRSFLTTPIINFALIWCFDVMLRFSVRLEAAVGLLIKRLFIFIMKMIKPINKITSIDLRRSKT